MIPYPDPTCDCLETEDCWCDPCTPWEVRQRYAFDMERYAFDIADDGESVWPSARGRREKVKEWTAAGIHSDVINGWRHAAMAPMVVWDRKKVQEVQKKKFKMLTDFLGLGMKHNI